MDHNVKKLNYKGNKILVTEEQLVVIKLRKTVQEFDFQVQFQVHYQY